MTHEEWLDLWYPPKCNMLKDISVSAAMLNNRLYDWRELIYVQLQTQETKESSGDKLLVVRTPTAKVIINERQATITNAPSSKEASLEV